MSFFIGLLIGFTCGLGLVAAFAHYAKIRSRRRGELAKTVAAFARMTVEDAKKILPEENYPPWVVFKQTQKLSINNEILALNWLNLELTKIWPYVNEAASDLIRSNVEPLLEQYRPVILSSLTFSKLTLGTVAPQFTGISIIEDESEGDGVIMELEMQWDGNPNIQLDVKTRLGMSLPIQVKDIGFTGVFRLIFKPLVDEFPGFGAVCYSLKEKKDLDFKLKVIKGDLTTLPGISDAIEETIVDAIEDSITWPVRKIVPIIPGDYSDLDLKPVGTLEVKLVEARDLRNKDMVGKSDPYAELFIRPLRARTKRSTTISNQLSPIWNEHFEFIVEDASTQHLTVRVFDDEGIQSSELIGCARVSLEDLEPGEVKDVWLKLVKNLEFHGDNKSRGEIKCIGTLVTLIDKVEVHLELLYCPFGTESAFNKLFDRDFSLTSLEKILKSEANSRAIADLENEINRKKKEVILRGVLSVTVISAENLPSEDVTGKSDPFVALSMRKMETKAKTRVLKDSTNPVWNQSFDFVVEDALHDMLVLEVYDHDIFKKENLGRVIMTLTQVILKGELEDSFPLREAKSGKLNLHLKWTPQLVFRDQ